MSSLQKPPSTQSSSTMDGPADGRRRGSQSSRRRIPSLTQKHKRKASAGGDDWKPESVSTPGRQRLSVPRPRRCLPAYVTDPYEDDYSDDLEDSTLDSTVAKPSISHIAQHNYSPAETQTRPTGNSNDSDFSDNGERYSEDALPAGSQPATYYSHWRKFILETGPKIDPNQQHWIVPPGWHDRHKVLGDERDLYAEKKALGTTRTRHRQIWQRARRTLLRSPWIPLILRWFCLCLCIAALASSSAIWRNREKLDQVQRTSPLMAIVIDSVAVVYLFYATFDEYFSRPLGQRTAKSKVGVLLLDQLFIVSSSANATIAFRSVSQYSVTSDETETPLLKLQQSLAGILLITLIAWLMTFIVSILRVVERMEH